MSPSIISFVLYWIMAIVGCFVWRILTKNSFSKKSSLVDQLQIDLQKQLSSIDIFTQQKTQQAESLVTSAQSKLDDVQQKMSAALEKWREADLIIKSAEKFAKETQEFAHKESEKIMSKLDHMQTKLEEKEQKVDEKIEQLETQKVTIAKKEQEIDNLIAEQWTKLAEIAGMSTEEAKTKLFAIIESQNKSDISKYIEKYKIAIAQEADKEAINIISKIIPRIATNNVSEFTVTTVDIPSEDIKWKLIGREGRNVAFFEKTTGVEVIIDDTPLVVRLSCYDHDKRRIAIELLKKLIKDGRINPVYIEKTYNEIVANFQELLIEKGKEALSVLNLPAQPLEIVTMIGQFHMRYSYGQNLWIHSVEVAKMAEAMANELGLDPILAKKAGLLHDIGKVVAENGQSHTKIGAEVLRKYGYDEVTINTAEAHHHDIPLIHAIGWIVTAADAISASRPGARFNTKNFFVEKMVELEKIIYEVDGVEKVHIMQAGREIMVFVNPTKIDDFGVQNLIKNIAIKVEDKLDYPGMIRVVAIRETKVIDYLR